MKVMMTMLGLSLLLDVLISQLTWPLHPRIHGQNNKNLRPQVWGEACGLASLFLPTLHQNLPSLSFHPWDEEWEEWLEFLLVVSLPVQGIFPGLGEGQE